MTDQRRCDACDSRLSLGVREGIRVKFHWGCGMQKEDNQLHDFCNAACFVAWIQQREKDS